MVAPSRVLSAVAAICAFVAVGGSAAWAQGFPRGGNHEAWASYHVESLPREVRGRVEKLRTACGLPFAATHLFAIPLESDEGSFLTLHFENLWCESSEALVCRSGSCLHEVYFKRDGSYRLVLRIFADEATLARDGRDVRLHLHRSIAASAAQLRWNGLRFVEP